MYIRQLHLTQFRNYQDQHLEFSPGINCISGPNGSGKTNILDALHYLSFTRGFRSSQDKHAVQEDTHFFFNKATLVKAGQEIEVQCNYIKGKGKKVLINQQPLKKMSEHIGSIPLVAILPHDTGLIGGPSGLRRKFMDMLISQYDHTYLLQLIQYERILAQRNALLRLFAERGGGDADEIALWDMQLIPAGRYIVEQRQLFLQDFFPLFQHYFKRIISEREEPAIRYKSQLTENTEAAWQQLLAERLPKDRVMLYTTAGVHRDDLSFHINDQSVRNFGSQGQQKTFVIALKLAQYQLLQQRIELAPILLLDDIFDKLDEYRLQSIGRILEEEIEGQVFVTDTSTQRLKKVFQQANKDKLAFFEVVYGRVNAI